MKDGTRESRSALIALVCAIIIAAIELARLVLDCAAKN